MTFAPDPPIEDDRDVPPVPACARCETLQSRFPAERILNQSHLGPMYPPDDPLFGRVGRVLVCNGNEWAVFSACLRAERHWYGAQHTGSPDGVPVARTTYDAGRARTLERLDAWLAASEGRSDRPTGAAPRASHAAKP